MRICSFISHYNSVIIPPSDWTRWRSPLILHTLLDLCVCLHVLVQMLGHMRGEPLYIWFNSVVSDHKMATSRTHTPVTLCALFSEHWRNTYSGLQGREDEEGLAFCWKFVRKLYSWPFRHVSENNNWSRRIKQEEASSDPDFKKRRRKNLLPCCTCSLALNKPIIHNTRTFLLSFIIFIGELWLTAVRRVCYS